MSERDLRARTRSSRKDLIPALDAEGYSPIDFPADRNTICIERYYPSFIYIRLDHPVGSAPYVLWYHGVAHELDTVKSVIDWLGELDVVKMGQNIKGID